MGNSSTIRFICQNSRIDRDRKGTLASHGDLDYSLPAYLSSFPPSEKKPKAPFRSRFRSAQSF